MARREGGNNAVTSCSFLQAYLGCIPHRRKLLDPVEKWKIYRSFISLHKVSKYKNVVAYSEFITRVCMNSLFNTSTWKKIKLLS